MVRKRGFLMVAEPYFMKNSDWYYFDENEFMYKLTESAPEEAVNSYNEFYKSAEETQ